MLILFKMNYLLLFFLLVGLLQSCESSGPALNQHDMKEAMDSAGLHWHSNESGQITYSDQSIQDLVARIRAARLPDALTDDDTYGLSKPFLQDFLTYWSEEFGFEDHLARLNSWPNQFVQIQAERLHFTHHPVAHEESLPIVLLHGWPSTFLQMAKIVPLLNKSVEGSAPFPVVTISLPGYGFSSIPGQAGMAVHEMAYLLHQLLVEELGYEKFIIRASDIGAGVAKEWALAYPKSVIGLHLSGSSPYVWQVPDDVSAEEATFLQQAQSFMQQHGAYASLHSTEPQTLAFALNDSPAGLAAWILRRYHGWTDHGGDLKDIYSFQDLADLLTIYWMTETIHSSMRSYFESAHVYSPHFGAQPKVPTGFLMLANDIATAPRSWEARTYADIIYWREYPQGGHFAEWEQAALTANSIRDFYQLIDED